MILIYKISKSLIISSRFVIELCLLYVSYIVYYASFRYILESDLVNSTVIYRSEDILYLSKMFALVVLGFIVAFRLVIFLLTGGIKDLKLLIKNDLNEFEKRVKKKELKNYV